MDFYKYINSKDLAEHLEKLDFELKSHYCLWIILQNENLTLDEKNNALKEILKMPDYEFKRYKNKSVHKLINEYFDYLEVIKQELIKNDDNSFYTGFIDYETHTSHLAIYFKDYESCLKHIKEKISDTERIVRGYQIHKIPFNTYENTIKAKYANDVLTLIHKCGGFNLATTLFLDSRRLCEIAVSI